MDTRLRGSLTTAFGIPAWFWTRKSQEASGYWYYNARSPITSPQHVSVCRFIIKYSTREPGRADSYGWHRLSFVTQWCPRTSRAVLICVDLPAALEKHIQQAVMDLASNEGLLSHPFAYHQVILEHVIDIYDQGKLRSEDNKAE
jgi:hypothetical protein